MQRRIWAGYLSKGFTRTSFSRALGVAIQTVDRWDQEKATPELALFLRACELLGYTPNQMAGIASRDDDSSLAEYDNDESLTADERDAFGSTVSAYAETIKPTFIAVYRTERAAGSGREVARSKAHAAAIEAHGMILKSRAVRAAIEAGGKPANGFAARKR